MKKNLSKFLSLILRHKPESIGLKLDKNGWANIDELIKLAPEFTLDNLKEIVVTCPKQRYKIENNRIRANQGHSVQIDLELLEKKPPDLLFHGTAIQFLDSILNNGLNKQQRHHVHLSENYETAIQVGKRRGKPVILEVNSKMMFEKGIKFYQSENFVWLTDFVSSDYLKVRYAN